MVAASICGQGAMRRLGQIFLSSVLISIYGDVAPFSPSPYNPAAIPAGEKRPAGVELAAGRKVSRLGNPCRSNATAPSGLISCVRHSRHKHAREAC